MNSRTLNFRVTMYLLIGLAMAIAPACSTSFAKHSVAPSKTTASSAAVTPTSPNESRPETRVMPLNVDGKVSEVELKLFNQASLPLTTYVPGKEFSSEVGSSGEGKAVRFNYSPDGKQDGKAYIHIFLPTRSTSLEGIQDLLLNDGGLLASNGWELVDRTDIVSYAWAREKLIYQQRTGNQTFVGAIYVGEHNSQAFYAFTHYPVEYSNDFEPRSTVVLESLQFRDEQ
ncbi:hypothetical protein IFO70_13970 [Phormidium tenue FACHB-886]|nr:hypothetical protein [Phormidium tenue FACHB-886]